MVIRKADQRLQVRDNVRGGNGTLENRHIVEPDAMFGSATLFSEFFFDPGDSIGSHPHDNDAEVYYMLEGELVLIEDGVETVLKEGDASYAHSGVSHAIENRSDKPAKMLAVILKV
jgi:quercetin dioxygenase-like cupin family protein